MGTITSDCNFTIHLTKSNPCQFLVINTRPLCTKRRHHLTLYNILKIGKVKHFLVTSVPTVYSILLNTSIF